MLYLNVLNFVFHLWYSYNIDKCIYPSLQVTQIKELQTRLAQIEQISFLSSNFNISLFCLLSQFVAWSVCYIVKVCLFSIFCLEAPKLTYQLYGYIEIKQTKKKLH